MFWQDKLVPNPMSSDREYSRYYYLDLPDLDDSELSDELDYLLPCLRGLPRNHWLRERVVRMEYEQQTRGSASIEPGRPKKPKPTGVIQL